VSEVFLHGWARTPVGRYGGALREQTAADLGALAVRAGLERVGLAPAAVDRLVFGTAIPADPEDLELAVAVRDRAELHRAAAVGVAAGSATGLEAVAIAVEAVRAGASELAVAGGAQSSSRIPYWSPGTRFGAAEGDPGLVDPLFAAVAAGAGSDRAREDEWAARSHRLVAQDDPALVPVAGVERDEAPGTATDPSALKPLHDPDGTVTAGNSALPADGAAALVLGAGAGPLRVLAAARHAADPLAAATAALSQAGTEPAGLAAVEIHESDAAHVLATIAALDLAPELVNAHGGAIATGSPAGAAGALLACRLATRLSDSGGVGLALLAAPGGACAVVFAAPG
jgi:acetyl-CoA acetyltransferase